MRHFFSSTFRVTLDNQIIKYPKDSVMLHGSDLLSLKVSDVMNESGTEKKEVQIKQKKTK